MCFLHEFLHMFLHASGLGQFVASLNRHTFTLLAQAVWHPDPKTKDGILFLRVRCTMHTYVISLKETEDTVLERL